MLSTTKLDQKDGFILGDNRDKAGYRGGGRAKGGFGHGRGPATCHNCQQPRHYAKEFPLPPATCMYFRASDHETEECPTLLVKIQEKRNQNN
jgi:hypothetical protein